MTAIAAVAASAEFEFKTKQIFPPNSTAAADAEIIPLIFYLREIDKNYKKIKNDSVYGDTSVSILELLYF